MPRPVPTFHDFVGRRKLVAVLRRQLAGAQARGQPFPHALFTGTSGLGKTLLARALAAEFGTDFVKIFGEISTSELVNRLIALTSHAFLFIDEAHSLETREQELLQDAIEYYRVPNPDGAAANSDSGHEAEVTTEIEPFTLLLATDQPGDLRNALLKRMDLIVPLDFYPVDELREIVDRVATDMDLLLSPQAARQIAQISAGLPRRAEQRLKSLRNHFPNAEQNQISLSLVREFMRDFEIDEKGLGPQERHYLGYLAEAGTASLESLAICLGIDCNFVRRQVEPPLLRERLVTIGPGGRRLTPQGQAWITQLRTNDNSQESGDHGQD